MFTRHTMYTRLHQITLLFQFSKDNRNWLTLVGPDDPGRNWVSTTTHILTPYKLAPSPLGKQGVFPLPPAGPVSICFTSPRQSQHTADMEPIHTLILRKSMNATLITTQTVQQKHRPDSRHKAGGGVNEEGPPSTLSAQDP